MQPGGSFNGLAWGPGQTLHLSAQKGLSSAPPKRITDVERLGAHGVHLGRDQYGARIVTIDLVWEMDQTSADFATMVHQIDAAMQIMQDGVLPLYVDGGTKLLWVRPGDHDVDEDFTVRSRSGHAVLQFRAADPLIYDAAEASAPVPVSPPTGGGWTFPWTFPWTFTITGASAVTVFNSGTIDVAPRFRVGGPVIGGFSLQNMNTGAVLKVQLDLLDSDWCDVDMATERVLFQSTADRTDAVLSGTDFWTLLPGQQTVRMELLGSPTAASCQMFFRSAYTSV